MQKQKEYQQIQMQETNQINEEILQGAKNRVKNLKEYAENNNIKADFYISSEAGITDSLGEWIDINAVVVEDSKGFQSIGTSQGFLIPDKYIEEIKATELGKVMDKIYLMDKNQAKEKAE